MPKNERIIELYKGISKETDQPIWDRIHTFDNLKEEDRIRIYEDKLAKDNDTPIIDGYIKKTPKTKMDTDIMELEFETVNNRNARLEREKLASIKKN